MIRLVGPNVEGADALAASSLWAALGLSPKRVGGAEPRAVLVTAVGAGGKTTLLHSLAAEAAAEGARVAITTTTHMAWEPGMATTLAEALDRLGAMPPQGGQAGHGAAGRGGARRGAGQACDTSDRPGDRVLLAGLPLPVERGAPAKIAGFGSEGLDALARAADVVLVEGDGSRRLPFKVPAAHEPVVPAVNDHLIVVAGLAALGRPLREVCCRIEVALALAPEATPETALTPALAAHLLSAGYLDPPGLAGWRGRRTVVLSHADLPAGRRAGLDVAAALAPTPVLLTGLVRTPTGAASRTSDNATEHATDKDT